MFTIEKYSLRAFKFTENFQNNIHGKVSFRRSASDKSVTELNMNFTAEVFLKVLL